MAPCRDAAALVIVVGAGAGAGFAGAVKVVVTGTGRGAATLVVGVVVGILPNFETVSRSRPPPTVEYPFHQLLPNCLNHL